MHTDVFWAVGYATSHQRPQYAREIHYPPSGTTARVPVILTCHTPLVFQWMWDQVGTYLLISGITYTYEILLHPYLIPPTGNKSSDVLSTPITLLSRLIFSTLLTMWSCPGLGMSVIQCLPIPNRQNQSNTIVSDTHLATQTAGWLPATLRSWINALWSWLDRLTMWYTIFQLRCNVACTSNLPSWLYSSPQGSASVFSKLKTQPCHLPYMGVPQTGFSCTCPIFHLLWGNYALYHCVAVNSNCKSQAWCKFWGVHISVD